MNTSHARTAVSDPRNPNNALINFILDIISLRVLTIYKMNFILSVLLSQQDEFQYAGLHLLAYCTIASIVTIIEGLALQYVSLITSIIMGSLYVMGMGIGFLISISPLVNIITSLSKQPNSIDTYDTSPKHIDSKKIE